MGSPKGGKVCWGNAGGNAADFYQFEQYYLAETMESAESPFTNGALRTTRDFNGFDQTVYKFDSGQDRAVCVQVKIPDWYDPSLWTWHLDWHWFVIDGDAKAITGTIHANSVSNGDSLLTALATAAFNFITENNNLLTIRRQPSKPSTNPITAGDLYNIVYERTDNTGDSLFLYGLHSQFVRT